MEYSFAMLLHEFKAALRNHPRRALRFMLPNGSAVPIAYHITEVGHVTKRFIDCGGTSRAVESVQLQLWLGRDTEHRLTAAKVAQILDVAKTIVPRDDVPV